MKEGAEPGKLETLTFRQCRRDVGRSTGIGRAMSEAQMADAGSRSSGSGSWGGLDAVRWRFSMQIVTRRECVFGFCLTLSCNQDTSILFSTPGDCFGMTSGRDQNLEIGVSWKWKRRRYRKGNGAESVEEWHRVHYPRYEIQMSHKQFSI